MGEFNGDPSVHEKRAVMTEIAQNAEREALRAGLTEARAQIADLMGREKQLREDVEEAVDLAHRLLAARFPAFPYLGERKGGLFLLGRALLKKHGKLQDD